MAKNKLTDGSTALQEKQTRVITIEATEKPRDIKLRVAAYTRVSSASDDQLNSFAAQNCYYTTLISGKENWKLVDIYADEGITGTSVEKREDFQRLLADCRRGLIDRVLVKSISRFARNTKECLEALRELKLLGISVYFEKENIDTATMSGEMMTTLFASFAQAESESISGNIRWGVQKRMQEGTYLPSSVPYGYRLKNRELEIELPEALIVNEIFQEYLRGKNKAEIARQLNERSVPSSSGKLWRANAIAYMLSNERYIGNSLWQKTYPTDTLPTIHRKNRGERPQYYAEGTNVPLISKETFEQTQNLLACRKAKYAKEQTNREWPFSKKISCGKCGKTYRKKIVQQTAFWVCPTHEESPSACTILQLQEKVLEAAFLRMYWKLKNQGMSILTQMLTSFQTLRNRRMLWSPDVIEQNKRISELLSQNQMLTTLKQQHGLDDAVYRDLHHAVAGGQLILQRGPGDLDETILAVSDGLTQPAAGVGDRQHSVIAAGTAGAARAGEGAERACDHFIVGGQIQIAVFYEGPVHLPGEQQFHIGKTLLHILGGGHGKLRVPGGIEGFILGVLRGGQGFAGAALCRPGDGLGIIGGLDRTLGSRNNFLPDIQHLLGGILHGLLQSGHILIFLMDFLDAGYESVLDIHAEAGCQEPLQFFL